MEYFVSCSSCDWLGRTRGPNNRICLTIHSGNFKLLYIYYNINQCILQISDLYNDSCIITPQYIMKCYKINNSSL